jgi:hypothetical protein
MPSGGKASNAALHDDEDVMARRRKNMSLWARIERRKRASQGLSYPNSPEPPKRVLDKSR